ncbi:MAG: response regulator [Rhodoferax sp.]|nr:response regulator [Rhodoferax sp.]
MILKSIRARMLAAALLPVTLVVSGIVVAFWMGRVGDLDRAHTERSQLLVRQLEMASEYAVFSGNLLHLHSVVTNMVRVPHVKAARVFDTSGEALAGAGTYSPVGLEELQDPGYLQRQRAAGIDTLVQTIKSTTVQLDDLFGPSSGQPGSQPRILGYVVIDIARDGLFAQERDLLLIAIAMGALGLLLGGVLAVRMGEGVVKPILRVSRSIERIGGGDFVTQAPIVTGDPLHELQHALNQMAIRLAWGRDELEQRVTAATLELRARKEEAEEATVAKSRFLASASHDLRQPTHALGMFIARLGQLPLDGQTSELVGNLEASVQAMQDLLDGLLDLSKLEAGAVQVHLAPVSLERMLSGVAVALNPIATGKGLRLRLRPTRLWAMTDPVLIHRIVMNLAHNALRYTERGTVLIACRLVDGGSNVRLEVWDSGIGISPEHQTQIFKEFYQVGNSGRDRSYGLGLGLSIVERSAKLLGHPLALRSAAGCGTRISITLPCVAPAQQPERTVSQETSMGADATGLRVLVIEDDDFAREALQELLNSWSYQVEAVSSMGQARDYLAFQGAPDIIVSDYRLGHGENGLDAIVQLRALAGRDVPACLMSGDTDAQLMQAAMAAGLTLLHKPVRPAKLRSLLRRLWTSAAPPV